MDTFNNHREEKEQVSTNSNQQKNHVEDLGLEVPENYFKNSKQSILDKIAEESQETQYDTTIIDWRRKRVGLFIAASVAIIFGLAILKVQQTYFDVDKKHTHKMALLEENDDLINSLFVEEYEAEDVIDDFFVDKLLEDL
ncbi:hypothetical protein ACXGQW_03750 [Wenyingzhuangia sp. IMCC45533]